MPFFKSLYLILGFTIAAYTVGGGGRPAAKGEYCTIPAAVESPDQKVRGNFTFCLEVNDKSHARFLVKVLDATYRKGQGQAWKTVDQKEPCTVSAVLVYQHDDGYSQWIDALDMQLKKPMTIQGQELPGELTAGSHTFEIRCDEFLRDVDVRSASLRKDFTFNIKAA